MMHETSTIDQAVHVVVGRLVNDPWFRSRADDVFHSRFDRNKKAPHDDVGHDIIRAKDVP